MANANRWMYGEVILSLIFYTFYLLNLLSESVVICYISNQIIS